MEYFVCVSIGYLLGAINPAYLISRIRGFDIRRKGSGNAGASNAVIVLGKAVGAFCALFDIGKTCFAIWLTGILLPSLPYRFVLTGSSCILGHIFPFYMKFKGGKGLACLGGMILTYDWRVFLVMLSAEGLVLLLSKYLCFVPITASVVFSVIYGVIDRDLFGAMILLGVSLVILFKHKENLHRILCGGEARISYLWDKEGETARLQENTGLKEEDFF